MSPPVLKLNYRQSVSPTHKRIRSSTALQGPRGRYNNYHDAKIDWLSIFRELHPLKNKKEQLSNFYPLIKYSTFKRRYREWKECGQQLDGCGDDRGGHNAAMTVEQEELCAIYIRSEYIEKKKPINQTDLSALIVAFYNSLHPQPTRSTAVTKFVAGSAFMQRFMKKYQFYNNNGRVVKQPQITDRSNAAAQLYLAQCARAYKQYGAELVYTMDETFWPLVPKMQQLVRLHNNTEFKPSTEIDTKAGMTMVVTVAASGEKLPLYFIGKGKTMRCTNKFGDAYDAAYYCYSESGWMKEDTMHHYLDDVVIPASDGRPCALVMDSYRAHITDGIYEKAKENNIEIIVVPACMTSILSPLDVGVNGILKSSYSKSWRQARVFGDALTMKTSWKVAVELATKAYKKVTSKHIRSSFKKATSLPPPEEDTLVVLLGVEEKMKINLERIPTTTKKEKLLRIEEPSRKSERLAIDHEMNEEDDCANDYMIAISCMDDIYEVEDEW